MRMRLKQFNLLDFWFGGGGGTLNISDAELNLIFADICNGDRKAPN